MEQCMCTFTPPTANHIYRLFTANFKGHALNPARPSSLKAGPARPKNWPGQEDVQPANLFV